MNTIWISEEFWRLGKVIVRQYKVFESGWREDNIDRNEFKCEEGEGPDITVWDVILIKPQT
jgi:hypothetical protein